MAVSLVSGQIMVMLINRDWEKESTRKTKVAGHPKLNCPAAQGAREREESLRP